MSAPLRAPFPWFGGKSRAAGLVWSALGDVTNYVEPFAGSLAVMLARPRVIGMETVNDADAHLCNFWRAAQASPDAVTGFADWPVNEADLHARHKWLLARRAELLASLDADPEFFDAKTAGWWLWGLSQWIGDGWCGEGKPSRKIPNIDGHGGKGVHSVTASTPVLLRALAKRLRGVRVACGDWRRVLGGSALRAHGACGIFLDPPYADGEMDYAAGGMGSDIFAETQRWAIEHGADRGLRIVLAGYDGGAPMPAGWRTVEWTASRGFGSADNENRHRERLWLSPHCIGAAQRSLFDGVTP